MLPFASVQSIISAPDILVGKRVKIKGYYCQTDLKDKEKPLRQLIVVDDETAFTFPEVDQMFIVTGIAPVEAIRRYTFGSVELNNGFQTLTVLIGLSPSPRFSRSRRKAASPSAWSRPGLAR